MHIWLTMCMHVLGSRDASCSKRFLHSTLHAVSVEPHCVSSHWTTENRSAAFSPLIRGITNNMTILSTKRGLLGDPAVFVGFVEKRRFHSYDSGHVANSHLALILSTLQHRGIFIQQQSVYVCNEALWILTSPSAFSSLCAILRLWIRTTSISITNISTSDSSSLHNTTIQTLETPEWQWNNTMKIPRLLRKNGLPQMGL